MLVVLAFVIFFWNYDSKANQSDQTVNSSASESENNEPVDGQMQRMKDERIQNLEASNRQFRNKIEESGREIQRLQEEHSQAHSDCNLTEEKFVVPKFVWLYLSRPANEENYVTQRGIENIKWYSQQSGFELRIVGRDNYGLWLNTDETAQLGALVKGL